MDGASAAAAQLCAEVSCAREGTSTATVCAGVPHSAAHTVGVQEEQRPLELGARGPRAQAAVYTAAHRRVRDRRAEAARAAAPSS